MVNTNERTRAPPALNPELPGLTQPYKDFVSLGLITKLTLVMKPGGHDIQVDVADHVPMEGSKKGLAPGIAKAAIVSSGLAPEKGKKGKSDGKKKENPLPKRTITASDAENVQNIATRIREVAKQLGPGTALGRIGSLKMHIEGATTFEKWWSEASAGQRMSLVTDQKHLTKFTPDQQAVFGEVVGKMESPFRGPLPQKSNDNSKKEAEKAPAEGSTSKPAAKPVIARGTIQKK